MQAHRQPEPKEDPAAHAVTYALLVALVSAALVAAVQWLMVADSLNALISRVSDCLVASACLASLQGH